MIKIELLQARENEFVNCNENEKPTPNNQDSIYEITFFAIEYTKANVGVL